MKLIERTVEQKFYYGKETYMIETTIEKYTYNSEKEKYEHSKEMQKDGFEDSGTVRKNFGTVAHPLHVYFGDYFKYRKINLT